VTTWLVRKEEEREGGAFLSSSLRPETLTTLREDIFAVVIADEDMTAEGHQE